MVPNQCRMQGTWETKGNFPGCSISMTVHKVNNGPVVSCTDSLVIMMLVVLMQAFIGYY